MEIILIVYFAIFLTFFFLYLVRLLFNRLMVFRAVKKWGLENQLQLESVRIIENARVTIHSQRDTELPAKPGQVVVRFRRPNNPTSETASVVWHGALFPELVFPNPDRVFARIEASPEELERQAFERDVRFETSRRLNAITSRTGWAKEHDLDGSGKIEPDEWEILKKKVEAEVRAEKNSSDADW